MLVMLFARRGAGTNLPHRALAMSSRRSRSRNFGEPSRVWESKLGSHKSSVAHAASARDCCRLREKHHVEAMRMRHSFSAIATTPPSRCASISSALDLSTVCSIYLRISTSHYCSLCFVIRRSLTGCRPELRTFALDATRDIHPRRISLRTAQ